MQFAKPVHGRPKTSLPLPARQLQVLLFDYRGILYDDSAWKRWLLGLLARMGLHTHYSAFFRVWDREFEPRVWRGECTFAAALQQFLFASGLTRPQVDEILAATRAKLRAFEQQVRPFAGVCSTVKWLVRSNLKLLVVSRMPASVEEVAARLAQLGLSDSIAVSPTVADNKWADEPRQYFAALLDQLSCEAQHAAYIGRDPADLQGAAQCGLLTIAFNHDPDAVADLHLDQFDQLPDLVHNRRPLLAAG